jgi:hypothetical protein
MPICHHCREPISREHVFALAVYWHPDHFLCQRCRRRIGDEAFIEEDGKPYHVECVAPRCACCGQLCIGHYQKDRDQVPYCGACAEKAKGCIHCGRMICPGKRECRVCASSAIVSETDAQGQVAAVLDWVRRQGVPIRQNAGDIELKLVRAETLSHRFGAVRHVGETIVRFLEFRGVRRYSVSVTLAVPMPQTLFRGVAAHELGHVWMMTENISQLSQSEAEGFCELLAYLFYLSEASAQSKRLAAGMFENPDPIYGKGFRMVHQVYEKRGLDRIVRALLSTGRMPPD